MLSLSLLSVPARVIQTVCAALVATGDVQTNDSGEPPRSVVWAGNNSASLQCFMCGFVANDGFVRGVSIADLTFLDKYTMTGIVILTGSTQPFAD